MVLMLRMKPLIYFIVFFNNIEYILILEWKYYWYKWNDIYLNKRETCIKIFSNARDKVEKISLSISWNSNSPHVQKPFLLVIPFLSKINLCQQVKNIGKGCRNKQFMCRVENCNTNWKIACELCLLLCV